MKNITLTIYEQDYKTIYVKYGRKILCKFFFDYDTENALKIATNRVEKDGTKIIQLYCENDKYITCYNNGAFIDSNGKKVINKIDIEYEQMLFNNDLSIYSMTIYGDNLKKAFKTNNEDIIAKAIDEYYGHRDDKHLIYSTPEKEKQAKEYDKLMADYYKSID